MIPKYEYIGKYKYRLLDGFELATGIIGFPSTSEYLTLTADGGLMCHKGYAWDGASGPTIDTKSAMRASLGHDALYQLICTNRLPQSMRKKADNLLREWMLEDGAWGLRANIWYKMVRIFGGNHT